MCLYSWNYTINHNKNRRSHTARLKTGKSRKSRKSGKLFSEIFKSEFSILALGQNRKLGNKKTRRSFSEISDSSDFSDFSICHFFSQQKNFFSQYSKVPKQHFAVFFRIGALKTFGIFLEYWEVFKNSFLYRATPVAAFISRQFVSVFRIVFKSF